MLCGKPGEINIKDEALAKAMIAWLRMPPMRRPYVQREFPELSPGLREQMLSGSHEACFDKAFPPEEETS